MHTAVQLLLNAPVPIATAAVVLRYGPSAVVFLVAGVAAVLVPGPRGERALTVLRLLRATATRRTFTTATRRTRATASRRTQAASTR
ncbi:hypothetical protein ABZ816_12410 [Actinosynnema sp. NPDC047251]|uniref:Putative membrane protein n=1 Tax=Saccharothrix espanaensis (strain ATCC 51144 / DSM 44229 / JCM 9112 / NBRC 15066 / NRRL 15764) TaxID=1179773 RepID=K0KF40_SACES|nr:hypothetical protein [Saccharothrix espanaensis]CCH35399.1 putative membrane protein [Saccharothrix espanaensis DSM 44229]